MNNLKTLCLTAAIATSSATFAGGILTNTNQNVAFNRMMSREASIGIDGVYYNPAGVVFMGEGHHLSINWQLAYQTRTIDNDYPLFTNNVNNPHNSPKVRRERPSLQPYLHSNMPTIRAMVVPGQLRSQRRWRQCTLTTARLVREDSGRDRTRRRTACRRCR